MMCNVFESRKPKAESRKPMPNPALTQLLRGKGAHADPIACIEDVDEILARRRIDGFPHSIADLVFHMNYWMSYELHRIRGDQPKYPEHNAESFPDAAAKSHDWDQLRRDLSGFYRNSRSWQTLRARNSIARSNRFTKPTRKSPAHSNRFSGKWSPTTAITPARSPWSAVPQTRGRQKPEATHGEKKSRAMSPKPRARSPEPEA
jgi:hypothetical protein